MPVLFICQHCHQTMRASRRKGGTIEACPQCGQPNLVPIVPLGDVAAAPTVLVKAETGFAAGVGGFEDIGDLIAPSAGPIAPAVVEPPPARPTGGIPSFAPAAERRGSSAAATMVRGDDALLVISRRGVYAQGALMLSVALAFLAAGYQIGRGPNTGPAGAGDTSSTPGGKTVIFEGNLTYVDSSGESKPDTEAVVIALPCDKHPDHKLASHGLRPTDSGGTGTSNSTAAMHVLGGAHTRAGAEGEFRLVLPSPGKYFVLLISKHAKREAGRSIEFDDLRAMGVYFEHSTELIGTSRYDWSVHELAVASPRLTHEFPATAGPSTRSTSSGRQFP